ncbi:AraC family transcriptional regulator ligand-binding domain-containing protein [Novosphingobium malaysiense]|uniref:HTH araC/xylS-type domain-containing protein n=1 Tax=Novosphingobium malaysiense TaxID=1348853 RepID=A0A0B1ZMH7_9SPHN|nr:AraC family transcriptional regulator ligand-binding domain-containing protein [Novosphingobium malaysiense]KHK90388.1 hypothetical protein LK12_17515 [Novosphingobium malaysiense]
MEPFLIRLAEKIQASRADVVATVRVDELAEPFARWKGEHFMRFIERVRQATGDEHMGLGEHPWPLGSSDFIVEVGARCQTLREAIGITIRYWAMTTRNILLELVESESHATLVLRQPASGRDAEFALSDWSLISLYTTLQWWVQSDLSLDRIEFCHPLDCDYSAYFQMFSGECVFKSNVCSIKFPRAYLDRPVLRTAEEAVRLARHKGGKFSKQALLFRSWRQRVSNEIQQGLRDGSGTVTLEQIAAKFNMSVQTVRRKLRSEGQSYRSVKAEARRQAAMQVLSNRPQNIEAASAAAGFADANALTRALRHSTGLSATELREQVLGWQED